MRNNHKIIGGSKCKQYQFVKMNYKQQQMQAKRTQLKQSSNFEEEKRGPFGLDTEDKQDSRGAIDKTASVSRQDAFQARTQLSHRNKSASPRSGGSTSSQNSNICINFDEATYRTGGIYENPKSNYPANKFVDVQAFTQLSGDMRGGYGHSSHSQVHLTKQQREYAIQQHNTQLDSFRSHQGRPPNSNDIQMLYRGHGTMHYGTFSNQNSQWSYDPDEENTPNQTQTYELKQMTLETATGHGKPNPRQFKESPMQNHYISSAASQHRQYLMGDKLVDKEPITKEDFEDMFDAAHMKKSTNVTMVHATSPKNHKSKIGSSSLTIAGSKLQKNEKPEQSIQNEGSTKLIQYLEERDRAEGLRVIDVTPQISHSEYEPKHHMLAQQKEAYGRRDNKITTQLKTDYEPAIRERKEHQTTKIVQKQLEMRKQKKESEQTSAPSNQYLYNASNQSEGGMINQKINSFFTVGGREQNLKESMQIRETNLNDLIRQNFKNDQSSDEQDQDQDNIRQFDQFMQSSNQSRRQRDIYSRELDEAKESLGNSMGDKYSYYMSSYDTFHPSKMHDVVRNTNMISTLGQGTTGSNLGYGNSQSFHEYHMKGLPNQKPNNKIGSSQYHYTENFQDNQFQTQIQQQIQRTPMMGGGYSQIASNVQKTTQMPSQKQPQVKPVKKNRFGFIESQSKYISLRKFHEDQSFNGTEFAESIYPNRQQLKDLTIQQWFRKLLAHEKAIVLTVIDQELVNLVKQMHKKYAEHGHGVFTTEGPSHQNSPNHDQFLQVGNAMLYFKRPTGIHSILNQSYDIYGSKKYFNNEMRQQENQSKILEEQQGAHDNLINNLNIIKIGNDEAITLNNYYLESTEYLEKMFKLIDPSFLVSELKIEKTDPQNALKDSIIKSTNEDKGEMPTQTGGKQQSRNRDINTYFLINERDSPKTNIQHTVVSSNEFKQRTTMYANLGTKNHPENERQWESDTQVSLAQVIIHIFEKAINVQFQDFVNKLSSPMSNFFFTQDQNNIYTEDLKLAQFWKEIKPSEVQKMWTMIENTLEDIVKSVKTSSDYRAQPLNSIEEVSDDSTGFVQKQMKKDSFNQDMKKIQHKLDQNEKMIEAQTGRLTRTYVDWNDPDDEKQEPDSDDTQSDDLEKNRGNYNQNYKNLGYQRLKSRDNSIEKTGAPGLKIPSYNKAAGKGRDALDVGGDTTLSEEDSDFETGKKDNLRAVYSTQQDKQQLSEGEIDMNYNRHDHTNSESNYENDQFEDEDDMDDDFNLPDDHRQNNEFTKPHPNIREQMQKEKMKQPNYTSTGSQATYDYNNTSRKEENAAHKHPIVRVELTKEQIEKNKENQKEIALKGFLKKELHNLKECGSEAMKQDKRDFNRCYLFIRHISTDQTLSKNAKENYKDMSKAKLKQQVHAILKKEQENQLMKDLVGDQKAQGTNITSQATNVQKKNKKKNKKAKQEGVVQASAEPAPSEIQPPKVENMTSDQPVEEIKTKKAIRTRKNKKKKKAPAEEVPEEKKQADEPEELDEIKSQEPCKDRNLTPLKQIDFEEHYGMSESSSLKHLKRELADAENQNNNITQMENQLIEICQKQLDRNSAGSMSSLNSYQQSQINHEKYKAERTSLLHGEVRYDKYPEQSVLNSELDNIGKQLERDSDLILFAPGLRKRTQEEINAAKRNEKLVVSYNSTEMKGHLQHNNDILSSLNEMNLELETTQNLIEAQRNNVVKAQQASKYPKMQIVDLIAKNKETKQINAVVTDYSEKAETMPPAEEKKKKNKKQKKKKKNAAVENESIVEGLPESIQKAGKIAEDQRKRELQHQKEIEEQTSRWQQEIANTLKEEKEDDDEKYFQDLSDHSDGNYLNREEVINIEDIHVNVRDDEDDSQQQSYLKGAYTVDLKKCKEAAFNPRLSKAQMMEAQLKKLNEELKINDFNDKSDLLASKHETFNKFMQTGISSTSDLNNSNTIDMTKQAVKLSYEEQKKQRKAQFHELFQSSINTDSVQNEIPSIDANTPEATHDSSTQQNQTLNKKKQAKELKKKEAKEKSKLKAQQLKQKEAEVKAQKELKKKEQKEKKDQLKKMDESEKVDEDEPIETLKQQLTITQNKQIKLPDLRTLDEEDGRSISQHSSGVRANLQSKRVTFQGELSHDEQTKIPKRGSSRGSIASSNKNQKEDKELQELEGLFAQEYKKPQKSIVDSLNTSKKNTPDNSSSKPRNEQEDLNSHILNKKLEDLQRQTQNDDRLPKAGTRSNSLPLKKSVEKPVQESKPAKKEKKEKRQEYAQIQPQASIPVIRPQPPQPQKLTNKQKKKQKNQEQAAKNETVTKTAADKIVNKDRTDSNVDEGLLETPAKAEESKTKKKQKKANPAAAVSTQDLKGSSDKKNKSGVKVQEPAISQQRLQQLMSDDAPIAKTLKVANPLNQKVVKAPIDTSQMLKNIDTYKNKNQALYNSEQLVQQQIMANPAQFENQLQLFNQSSNHFDPKHNSFYNPMASNFNNNSQMFVPSTNDGQPTPTHPSQTINIDIISISLQQNMQQALNNQQQSIQQQTTNLLNLQNKQMIQTNVVTPTQSQQQQINWNQVLLNQTQSSQSQNQQMQLMNSHLMNMQGNPQNFNSQNFMNFGVFNQNQFNQANPRGGTQPNMNMMNYNPAGQMANFNNMMYANPNALMQQFNNQNMNQMFNSQSNHLMGNNNFQQQPNTSNSPNMQQWMQQSNQQQINMINQYNMFSQMMNQQQQQQQQSKQQVPNNMYMAQSMNNSNLISNTQYFNQMQQMMKSSSKQQMVAFNNTNNNNNVPALMSQGQDLGGMQQQIDSTTSQLTDQSQAFVPNNQFRGSQQQQMHHFQQQQHQMNMPAVQMQNQYQIPMQMYIAQQEFKRNYIQLAQSGYVLENSNQDYMALLMLNHQELSHVHEFYEVLDAQIDRIKVDQKLRLSKTQELRNIAFQMIKSRIEQMYKDKSKKVMGMPRNLTNLKIEIYGSMATGLAIDSSDLDILVHGFIHPQSPRYQNLSRDELVTELQMLHNGLSELYAIQSNQLIETASVPLIKIQMNLVTICERNPQLKIDKSSLDDEIKVLHVDITLDEPKSANEQQHLGIQCCNYIKQKIDQYPQLQILALLLKKFLSFKALNKPYQGGLSSYSLIQMILVILRLNERESFQNFNSTKSISMIFKKFVWLFGFNFDTMNKSITQQCEIEDRLVLQYILHAPQCIINTQYDGDSLMYGNSCDCGYKLVNSQVNNNLGGSQSNSPSPQMQDPQNNLFDLLSKLMHSEDKKKQSIQQNLIQNPYQFYAPSLIIIDPLNKFNNIGKSSYNFQQIQMEFRDVYTRINDEMLMFVRSCCSKQNGQVSQPYDVDGLISRILQIDYKLTTPVALIEEPEKQLPTKKNSAKSSKKNSPQQTETQKK